MKPLKIKRVAVAALFLCSVSGCAALDPVSLKMDRSSAWINMVYVDPPILFQGKEVDGKAECFKPGFCKLTLRKDRFPYGCLPHEIVHVFVDDFHDPAVPNGEYCLN